MALPVTLTGVTVDDHAHSRSEGGAHEAPGARETTPGWFDKTGDPKGVEVCTFSHTVTAKGPERPRTRSRRRQRDGAA